MPDPSSVDPCSFLTRVPGGAGYKMLARAKRGPRASASDGDVRFPKYVSSFLQRGICRCGPHVEAGRYWGLEYAAVGYEIRSL